MKKRTKILIIICSVLIVAVTVVLIIKNEMDYYMPGTVIVTEVGEGKTYYLIEDDERGGVVIMVSPRDNDALFEDLHSGDKIKVKTEGNGWLTDPGYIFVYNYRLMEHGEFSDLEGSEVWKRVKKYKIYDDIVEK